MTHITGLTLLFIFTCISGCKDQNDCAIKPNKRFDGDGLLLLEVATSEDGNTFVKFFPVCNVDTSDLIGSLRRANEGISIRVPYDLVQRALRNRVIRLTSKDPQRPTGLGKLYLTSVHLSFMDDGSRSNPSNKTFKYILNTEQVYWENSVRVTTLARLDTFDNL